MFLEEINFMQFTLHRMYVIVCVLHITPSVHVVFMYYAYDTGNLHYTYVLFNTVSSKKILDQLCR